MVYNAKIFIQQITKLKKNNNFKQVEILLEKEMKKHPTNIYIINSLIEVCLDKRFDRSLGLFNNAIKIGIADTITYSLILNKYIEKNDNLNVNYYFNKCVFNSKEDSRICNNVLMFFLDNEDYDKANELYSKTIKTKKDNAYTHSIMLSKLYKREKYIEGNEILFLLPDFYKEDILIKTNEIEFNRKLKNYDYCLDLISKINLERLSEDNKIQLKTIKAYCLKDMGNTVQASLEFKNLFIKTDSENESYVRIVCGYVFCDLFSLHEVRNLKSILEKALQQNKGNFIDVNNALKILKKKEN